ncbi:MAG TPA: ABC transporter substrate-binding protein [Actinocatenispora sp.]
MRRLGITLAILAVGATALTACSKNTGAPADHTGKQAPQTSAIDSDPAHSRGPAKPVSGARRGGTLYALQEADFEHLDPQNVYISDAESVGQLLSRSLTTYREDGSGTMTLVGDLATGPGTDVHHDCRVWRYTLKSGLRYEDGSTITAADVAYGVARSFSPDIFHGPHYVQQWLSGSLDYNAKYKGPYDGGSVLPPGVTVQGDKQITFTFPKPACDMPFAAAWGTTAPVPRSKDGKPTALDTHPFSSGPYKIAKYVRGTELDLVRNTYWDPRTDPIRHDYPDRIVTQIGATDVQQAQRVLASHGDDAATVARATVPAEQVPVVQRDSSASKRVVTGYTPYVTYLNINTERVTSLAERQAIEYAFNRRGYLQAAGGATAGEPATTIESPLTIGYHRYDAYPAGASGDPAKATKLLGGKHPKLVYAFTNTELGQKQAVVVQQALQRAGFTVVLKPVDKSSYYHQVGLRHSGYDIFVTKWGADWPSGSTIIPPLFDGRAMDVNGSWVWLNRADINAGIDRISAEDASRAGADWAKLDEHIMRAYAPVVPIYYLKNYSLVGDKVGGVFLSAFVGAPVYYNAYVKP